MYIVLHLLCILQMYHDLVLSCHHLLGRVPKHIAVHSGHPPFPTYSLFPLFPIPAFCTYDSHFLDLLLGSGYLSTWPPSLQSCWPTHLVSRNLCLVALTIRARKEKKRKEQKKSLASPMTKLFYCVSQKFLDIFFPLTLSSS